MAPGRCRVHGSATPRGTASANFRTGRYSKSLPVRFAAHYAEAMRDRKLLQLRDEIAFTDSQIRGALSALTDGDSTGFRERSSAAWAALKSALAAGDPSASAAAASTLDLIITAGAKEAETMAEARELIRDRLRLVEAERGHELKARAAVSLDEMRVLLAAIHAAISRHVLDPVVVSKIAAEVSRTVGADNAADDSPEN